MGMQGGAATLENNLTCIKTLNIYLTYIPEIPLLDNYPRETKAYVRKDWHMHIYNKFIHNQSKTRNANTPSIGE